MCNNGNSGLSVLLEPLALPTAAVTWTAARCLLSAAGYPLVQRMEGGGGRGPYGEHQRAQATTATRPRVVCCICLSIPIGGGSGGRLSLIILSWLRLVGALRALAGGATAARSRCLGVSSSQLQVEARDAAAAATQRCLQVWACA
jgi:hypothetical protein